jgi:putative MATE family efflux protein
MLKYYFPAFAGVMVNSLYNIVDRIFIGQGVGALALSGLSVVFPIMIIYMAFGMLVGSGAGVRISVNMGKKDFPRAEKVLGNAVFLSVVLGIFVTGLTFLIKEPLLKRFGAGPETFEYANDYLNIILLGSTFGMVGYSLNNIIRSEGNARVAMYSMFLSAGLNLILDPLFIFGLDMGVKGAALATVISQFVLCIWVIAHFRGKRSVLRLRTVNLKPVKEVIIYIVTIGFAPFAMMIASAFVQSLFVDQLIRHGGDIAVGAMGIINSVSIMLVMSIVALNMASQPIIGFNYGSRQYGRVLQTVKIGLKAATIIAVGGWLLCLIVPELIVGLFNSDNDELQRTGVHGLRIFNAVLPLVGYQIIASNLFQSIGKARLAAVLSLLRQVIFLVPLLIVLPTFFGLTGVWLAMPVSDFLSSVTSFVFLRREMKRLSLQKQRCTRKPKELPEPVPELPFGA